MTLVSSTADPFASERIDGLLDPYLQQATAALDGATPLLAGMARYHLGMVDAEFGPLPAGAPRGKRLRPAVAILCCAAAGGDPATAAPIGAALELLHNFTLIHDDIQDVSPLRHHRPTVWSRWGIGQAINAGDALFAAAHLPLLRLPAGGVPADLTLRLLDAFERTTLAIVQGQTLDLGFEGRDDVTTADYLAMIEGKTAAIVRYAAWAGALVGGADDATAERFGAFGRALGLGFQMRDDLFGVWGDAAMTGKEADDIRRRKPSLPVLLLRERLNGAARDDLNALYAEAEIDPAGVGRVMTWMEQTGVRAEVERRVSAFHDEAQAALLVATTADDNLGRDALFSLIEQLAVRVR